MTKENTNALLNYADITKDEYKFEVDLALAYLSTAGYDSFKGSQESTKQEDINEATELVIADLQKYFYGLVADDDITDEDVPEIAKGAFKIIDIALIPGEYQLGQGNATEYSVAHLLMKNLVRGTMNGFKVVDKKTLESVLGSILDALEKLEIQDPVYLHYTNKTPKVIIPRVTPSSP